MLVASVCHKTVVCARPGDDLVLAARMMRDHHVGFLIVVEPSDVSPGEQVVGVLTDRDVMVTVIANDVDPKTLLVEDVMTANPVTIHQEASLEKAMQVMGEAGVRRLPVVNDDQVLVGVLALDDVIGWFGEMATMMDSAIRKEMSVERHLRPAIAKRRIA